METTDPAFLAAWQKRVSHHASAITSPLPGEWLTISEKSTRGTIIR